MATAKPTKEVDRVDEVKKARLCDLGRFQFKRVLNEMPDTKTCVIEGCFDGSDEPAVVILEKTPFSEEKCARILKEIADSEKDKAPEETFRNDIYSGYVLQPTKELNEVKATLIYPATQKHIEKYSRQKLFFVRETAKMFKERIEPYLKENCFSVQWVYNILDHKKEQEGILFEESGTELGFVLCRDMKWDMKQAADLHCLALVQDRNLHSLRDLRGSHLPLLRNMRDKILSFMKDKYELDKDQVMMYFHYQPSYYHLHVHVVAVSFENPPGSSCNRGHLLDFVISKLEICSDFYEQALLCYTIKANDPLKAIIFKRSEEQKEKN